MWGYPLHPDGVPEAGGKEFLEIVYAAQCAAYTISKPLFYVGAGAIANNYIMEIGHTREG
jgi:hypothetical protein